MKTKAELSAIRAEAGRLGGLARGVKLSRRRLRQIGQKGARAKWAKEKGRAA